MSRFKKVIKKKELESALAKHPLKDIDEQIKKDYVRGLVFIAVEDENFSDEEKEYVSSLIKNIGLEESFLEECVTFANDSDEDEILAFMDRLKALDEDMKLNFLIEVIVISFKDGEFDESEQEMFDDYLDMLELTDKKDDIMYMALALVNKDIDLALSMYTAKKEFFNKFDYMFDMLDIDIEKELQNVYSFKWTQWETEDYGEIRENRKVSLNAETVQRVCIFINYLILSKKAERIERTNKFLYEDEELLNDGYINNLELDNYLYQYSCEKDSLILLTKDIFNIDIIKKIDNTNHIISLYIDWLNNMKHLNNIVKMDLYLNYSNKTASLDDRIAFKIDCGGKPSKGIYELGFGYAGYDSMDEIDDQNYNKAVFYEGNNFGDDVNNDTKDANPENFTFRLMKVDGQ